MFKQLCSDHLPGTILKGFLRVIAARPLGGHAQEHPSELGLRVEGQGSRIRVKGRGSRGLGSRV
eukprot:2768466-Rhodomonas_salina.1